MKKSLKLILLLVIVIIFVIGCKNNKNDTDISNNTIIKSKNYVLSIHSSKVGHQSKENAFSATIKVNNKVHNKKKYHAWYNIDYSHIIEHKAKLDYPNIKKYKKIRINNKKFRYTINSSSINLIYQPNNMNCYITVKVSLAVIYNKNGESVKAFNISIKDLSLKEIANTINFDIKKK